MRRVDDTPIDPEVAAALDAIDATLAGEAVDPAHAELAELALLLSAGRPQMDQSFAASLDQRVAQRFAWAQPAPRRRRTWWVLSPAWGGGLVAAATAFVLVLVLTGGGGSSSSLQNGTGAFSGASKSSTPAPASRAPASSAGASGTSAASAPGASAAGSSGHYGRKTGTEGVPALLPASQQARQLLNSLPAAKAPPAFSLARGLTSAAPTPPSGGRKIVQSAQLSLLAPPQRLDAVAQEVFNVVGSQNGYVQHSTVTASGGPNAYAQFALSVPSANLSQTMSQLSQLKYASVGSRTDTTQDVNNQYVGDVRRLADAKALRTALLKQLAQAVTTAQVDSLNQRIHDADQAISTDQATLNSLNHQVDFSQIVVTINGAAIAPAHHHTSSGFTLGKAAHDAGRVLTVAAGVALVTLAALVPVALLAALGWWVVTAVRRRRREQALDMA